MTEMHHIAVLWFCLHLHAKVALRDHLDRQNVFRFIFHTKSSDYPRTRLCASLCQPMKRTDGKMCTCSGRTQPRHIIDLIIECRKQKTFTQPLYLMLSKGQGTVLRALVIIFKASKLNCYLPYFLQILAK